MPAMWIFLGFVALVLLFNVTSEEPPKVENVDNTKRVSAKLVELQSHSPEVSLLAQVQSPNAITFRAPIAGYIEEVAVRSGAQAAQGDLLIKMDLADISLQLQSSEAQLDSLNSLYRKEQASGKNNKQALEREKQQLEIARENEYRARTLYEKDLGSRLDYQTAQQQVLQLEVAVQGRETLLGTHLDNLRNIRAQKEQAQAGIDQIKLNMDRAVVRAEEPLLIGEVFAVEQEQAATGQPLLTAYQPDRIEVVAKVPSKHLKAMQKSLNDEVPVYARVEQQAEIRLQLSRLGNQVNQTGTVNAYFSIIGEVTNLKLGEQIGLIVEMPSLADSMLVPARTLHSGDRVYLIDSQNRLKGIYVNVMGEAVSPSGEKQLVIQSPELQSGLVIMTTQMLDAAKGTLVIPVFDNGTVE